MTLTDNEGGRGASAEPQLPRRGQYFTSWEAPMPEVGRWLGSSRASFRAWKADPPT